MRVAEVGVMRRHLDARHGVLSRCMDSYIMVGVIYLPYATESHPSVVRRTSRPVVHDAQQLQCLSLIVMMYAYQLLLYFCQL